MSKAMSDQDFPFGPQPCPCGGTLQIGVNVFPNNKPHNPPAECQQCGFVWGVA